MPRCETLSELMELWSTLEGMMQAELPWICTSISNRVQHPDPAVRAEVQLNADHAVGVMSVIFLFAVLEAHDFHLDNKWLQNKEASTLRAWRHVRNCGSHGFRGTRVKKYHQDFDDAIGEQRIGSVKSWDSSTLIVYSTIGVEFLQWLQGTFQKLTARAANEA